MFEMPRTIKTEVFATLPQKYRKSKHGVFEGPSFDRNGNLYFVDIPFGRVFRLSPQGNFDLVTEYDGRPNGLKIHKDGRIFIADRRNGILLLDPASGKVSPVLEGPAKERFKGPNDLVFAANGDLYFTDQGQTGLHDPTGRVFRWTAQGQLHCLLNNIPSPNGIALDPTDETLYVAVTRDASIWKVPLLEDGSVGRAGIFVRGMFGGSPDGIAMDAAGNLSMTRFVGQEIWLFNKGSMPLCRIVGSTGHEHVTNLAYGGEDNKILFITEVETSSILIARMEVPGKVLFSHH